MPRAAFAACRASVRSCRRRSLVGLFQFGGFLCHPFFFVIILDCTGCCQCLQGFPAARRLSLRGLGSRLCGPVRLARSGESPRARGGLDRDHSRLATTRRIPARGGAEAPASADGGVEGGVSPRARGVVFARSGSSSRIRRIPARAGIRGRWTWRRRFREAHPRAGGAGRGRPFLDLAADGVSPRARGGRCARLPAAPVPGRIAALPR